MKTIACVQMLKTIKLGWWIRAYYSIRLFLNFKPKSLSEMVWLQYAAEGKRVLEYQVLSKPQDKFYITENYREYLKQTPYEESKHEQFKIH